MGNVQSVKTVAKLNYDQMKVKKGFIGGLFAGRKIDRANEQIKQACNTGNPNINKTNDDADKQYEIATDKDGEGEDGIDECSNEDSDGAVSQAEGEQTNAMGVATTEQAISTTAVATSNTELIEAMTENCEAGKEELMAAMQEQFEIMNAAGEKIAENMAEAEQLSSELDSLMEELDAAGAEEEGGEESFSTEMAAAGGENSAYSLDIASSGTSESKGASKAKAKSSSSGSKGASGGGSRAAAIAAQIQEKTGRLNEIVEENTALSEEACSAADAAAAYQAEYAETTEANQADAEAKNSEAEEGQREANNFEKVCQDVVEVGQDVTTVGTTVEVAGTLMNVIGGGVQTTGGAVQAAGTVLSGIGGGLLGLAAGLAAGVYTAVASAPVGASGNAAKGSGAATTATGNGLKVLGVNLAQAGNATKGVGEGVKAVGEITTAAGSVGLAASAIAHGEWDKALAAGLTFVGAAIGAIGDTAAFCQNMQAFKDIFKEGCGADKLCEKIAKVGEKVDTALGKATNKLGAKQTTEVDTGKDVQIGDKMYHIENKVQVEMGRGTNSFVGNLSGQDLHVDVNGKFAGANPNAFTSGNAPIKDIYAGDQKTVTQNTMKVKKDGTVKTSSNSYTYTDNAFTNNYTGIDKGVKATQEFTNGAKEIIDGVANGMKDEGEDIAMPDFSAGQTEAKPVPKLNSQQWDKMFKLGLGDTNIFAGMTSQEVDTWLDDKMKQQGIS